MNKIIFFALMLCATVATAMTSGVSPCNATAVYDNSGYNTYMDKAYVVWDIYCDTEGMQGCQWSYTIKAYKENELGLWSPILTGQCGTAQLSISCGNIDRNWVTYVQGVIQNTSGNYKIEYTIYNGPCNAQLGIAGQYSQFVYIP